jgi:hypothetical protein
MRILTRNGLRVRHSESGMCAVEEGSGCSVHQECPTCGGGPGVLRLLNPRGEEKGGIVNYSYRCGACHRYFREYRINKDLKIWGGS